MARCEADNGCMSFEHGGYRYYFKAIPRVGDCLFGYTASGGSADSEVSYYSRPQSLGDCESTLASFAPPDEAAQALDVDASALTATTFFILAIYEAGVENSCAVSVEMVFSRDSTASVCLAKLPDWYSATHAGQCSSLTLFEWNSDEYRPSDWLTTLVGCDDANATTEVVGVYLDPQDDQRTEDLVVIDRVRLRLIEKPRPGLCLAALIDKTGPWLTRYSHLLPCSLSDEDVRSHWTADAIEKSAANSGRTVDQVTPGLLRIEKASETGTQCVSPLATAALLDDSYWCLSIDRRLE
ncbi:MAG: hypothetical protein LBD70_04490 [Bifidobacteriaceae bacterium]|nr:hypothetical protein [Bifidobacteriaceae bacterium]